MNEIENLLNRIPLIDEINKQAQGSNGLNSLAYNRTFKDFVKNLEPNIQASNDDWQENNQLLALLDKLPSRLINQSNNGKNDMMTETKVAIAVGSALLLIGVAVGVYYAKKCANNPNNKTNTGDIKLDIPGAINAFRDKVTGNDNQSTSRGCKNIRVNRNYKTSANRSP